MIDMRKIRAGVIRSLLLGLNRRKELFNLFCLDGFNIYVVSRITNFLLNNKYHFWAECCTQKPTERESIIVATLYFAQNRQFSTIELMKLGDVFNPRATMIDAMTGLDGDATKRMRLLLGYTK